MRKKCLLLLLCMMTTVVAFAGKESLYTFYEGFEEGIPATWMQEYNSGQVSWVVEQSGASLYPAAAMEGNSYVALRNTTGQTQYFTTMLVSPVIDLTEVFQPILVFSHAQLQYAGDVDALRVYYRTSEQSRWVEIGQYTSKTKGWKNDTIVLTAPSATYQIAFEGMDQMGRGIALDEVILRPTPTCDDPSNISADGLTANTATLRWNGSLDTDSFRVVLSTTQLTDMANISSVVKDEFVFNFEWQVNGLQRDTKYFVYLQAYCGNAESEWASFSFKTKNLAEVPFVETFDRDYVKNTAAHANYWTHGTSLLNSDGEMAFMPYINQNTEDNDRRFYSYNSSTGLVFNAAITAKPHDDDKNPIPAGHYLYAATPEMNVDKVSNLQVTFWGGCFDGVSEEFMSSLIVGVMTDPADFSTFVPVDTVTTKRYRGFDRFTVDFASYNGNGKYIAFASNFVEKSNLFYMDEVVVEERSAFKSITDVNMSNYRGQSFELSANLNGNAQVQVVVARDSVDAKKGIIYLDPFELPAEYVLVNKTVSANEFPYTVEVPQNGGLVQVYLRGTDGVNYGQFTVPKKVLLPMKFTNDILLGFEEKEGSNVWTPRDMANFIEETYTYAFPYEVITTPQNTNGGTPKYPYSYQGTYGNGYESAGRVKLGKYQAIDDATGNVDYEQAVGDYIALPEVEDLKSVYINFWMMGYTTEHVSRVAVGVMTDPYNPATFDTLKIFEENEQMWQPFTTTFDEYKGTGKFPAIMALNADNKAASGSQSGSGGSYHFYDLSCQYIDNVTLAKKPDCMAPTGIVATATDSQIKFTWDANGMNQWVIRLYADADATEKLDSVVATTPTYTLENLHQHTTYYYTVAALCGEELTDAFVYSVTTTCAAYEAIPYIEDFESWEGGVMNTLTEPLCWVMPRYGSSTGLYPYVDASGSRAYKGKASWVSYSSSSIKPEQDLYAAMPLMNEDLQKLQVKFYAKPAGVAYVGDILYVGVMSDPNNIATFDTVAAVELIDKNWLDYIVPFFNYTGDGKYIAFMVPAEKYNRAIYVDEIVVDYLSDCEKIQNVKARTITSIGADLYWQKSRSTKWEVLLTTDTMTLGSKVEVDSTKILSLETATTMPYRLTSCPTPNKLYYVYVRAVCDENNKGEWSNPISFQTSCTPITAGNMGVIDFTNEDELDCWVVGVREGTTAAPSRNTNNYLYIFNTTASDGAYAIMPTLDVDSITRLQVTFDAHGGSTATYLRKLTVGVITNPSDLSTFTAIQTLDLNKVSATNAAANYGFNEARQYTVRFNQYMGDYNGEYGKNIMFISESGTAANYIYIRNVRVDTVGSCVEPLQLTLMDATANELTIGWEQLPSNKYQMQLLAEDKQTVLVDTILTNNMVKIDGLTMLTSYYAKVRQICGVGDTSIWSYPTLVETVCPAYYPLPYSENFDSYKSGADYMPECWERFHSSTSYKPYVNSSAKAGSTGNGFYIYGSTSAYNYVVLPALEGKIGEMMMSFDYRSNNTSNDQFFLIAAATDVTNEETIEATMTVIDTVNMPKYADPNKVWYYYSNNLSAYTGEGGNIVLISKGVNQKTYIDNIYIEKAPTCFRPIGFEFLKSTTSSVSLTWTPMGKETAWDIAYVKAGGDVEDATIVTVDKSNTILSGLNHSTDYDFYVRANCGNGDVSSWSDMISANTLYLVDLVNAKWNFDNYATQYPSPLSATTRLEKGWMVGNTKNAAVGNIPSNLKNTYNTTGAKTINNHYAKSDSCALKIGATAAASNGAYAIMPEINADYDTLQVRFAGRAISAVGSKIANEDSLYTLTNVGSTYQHSIKIGTLTDPYDITTFELLTDYTFQTVENAQPIVEGGYWEDVVVSLYGAKGKYIAFVSDYNAPNIVYIDDVIVEKVNPCIAPPNFVTMDALAPDRATFSWVSNADKWQVKITEVETGTIVDEATLTERTWTTTKLQPVVEYTFAVRTTCDDNASAWKTYDLKTPCVPVAMPEDFVVDFESNLYDIEFNQKLPECWEYGHLVGTDNATYIPQAEFNTTAYQYSRNVETDNTKAAALHLANAASSPTDHYVILPEMSFDLDTLALHFWARAAYFYVANHSTSSYRNRLVQANANYQKSIVIGAIADIEDMSTFVPMDTFTYSQSWTSTSGMLTTKDATGNDYWEEALIPLKDYQGKGRIVLFYPHNTKVSHFFIDDMSLVGIDVCYAASNLRATAITANAATLNWTVTGNDSVRLQVAADDQFAEGKLILDKVLVNANGSYSVAGLDGGKEYAFRVQHLCNEEESADWTMAKFTTLYDVRFYENFAAERTYPINWTRANGEPEEIFAANAKLSSVTDEGLNWQRATSCVFANTAIRTTTSSSLTTKYNHWLITPVIDLATADSKQQLMLSFQMGLSGNGGAEQLPNTPGIGDKFFVAVSEDGGNTWKKENTTWWSDDTEDNAAFSYAAIPLEGKMYNVDLSQYKGKQVKLAFVNYSVNTNSDNYIYLANITINNAVLETYAASTCQWCDYEDANFFIDANDLRVAETSTYTKYEQAKKDGVSDKLITMNLTVQAAANAIYQATICEGETYEQYNFTIQKATKSAVYKQKLTGVNACDSVVELNLTVLPKLRTTVEQTICQGDYYEFNGVKYYTSTIQSDTLTSQVTGCDSIVTLYLTVNAIIEGTVEEHLCQGESVEFGKFGTITEAGTYVDTIKNALGCDSAATLNVFVHAPVATTVRGAICEGESYTQDVWNGLTQAGDYPSEQETIWGCDSIVTLHLMVADANNTIYDNITSADLPYVLNGEELLPVGTTDGTYTKLIDLSCGTITAVITVGQVTDVNSVYQNSLALAPNLVTVGQETNVYGSFDEDAVLEVYHTTGALVYRSANTNVVPGLPTAGVYMVTVKSNNQVFQSMLIVQ